MELAYKPFLGLIFVIFLLYIVLKIIQKYSKLGNISEKAGSISLEGIFYIDDSTKLVSITNNKINYLLLISKNGNILLEKKEQNAKAK